MIKNKLWKKILKILGIFVGIIVALFVGIIVAVTLLLDLNIFKSDIENYAKNNFDIDLKINGDLSWSFYPNIGINFGEIVIQTPDDLENTSVFKVGNIRGSLNIPAAIFRREIKVNTLSIEGADIYLYRSPQNVANWETMINSFSSSSSSSSEVDASSLAPGAKIPEVDNDLTNNDDEFNSENQLNDLAVLIDTIEILNTDVVFDDRVLGEKISLIGFNFQASSINLIDFFPIYIAFELELEKQQTMVNFDASLDFRLSLPDGRASIRDFDLALGLDSVLLSEQGLDNNLALGLAIEQMGVDWISSIVDIEDIDLSINNGDRLVVSDISISQVDLNYAGDISASVEVINITNQVNSSIMGLSDTLEPIFGSDINNSIQIGKVNYMGEDVSLSQLMLTVSPIKEDTLNLDIDSLNANIGNNSFLEVPSIKISNNIIDILLDSISIRPLLASQSISGRISTNEFNPKDLMAMVPIEIQTSNPNVLERASLRISLSGSLDEFIRANLDSISLDDTNITGFVAYNLNRNSARVDIRGDRINLDDYLPPAPESTEQEQNVQENTSTDSQPEQAELLPLELIRQYAVEVDFNWENLQIMETDVDNISVSLNANYGDINLSNLFMNIFDGSVYADARINGKSNNPTWRSNLDIKNINLKKAASVAIEDFDYGEGSLFLVGNLNSVGNKIDPLIASSNGNMTLTVQNGVIYGVNLSEQMCRVISTLEQKETPILNLPPQTNIRELLAVIEINGGIINNENFTMDITDFEATGNGIFNLIELSFDYRAGLSIKGNSLDENCEVNPILRDFVFPVRCNSELSSPPIEYCNVDYSRVRSQISNIAREAANRKLQESQERVQDRLNEEIRKQQEEASERIQEQLQQETDRAKEQLEEQGRRLLEGLFN